MADISRSHGLVVKRAGTVFDGGFSDPDLAIGSKRSGTDRLGSSTDADAVYRDVKRQRGVNGKLSFKAVNGVDDVHLSKDDLRFKIMKQTQSSCQQRNVDLRDKLSQKVHPSSSNHGNFQSLPEPRNGTRKAPRLTSEPRVDRRHVPEHRDDPPISDERWHLPGMRDGRLPMPETGGEGRPMPKARDERQRMPEPRHGRQLTYGLIGVPRYIQELSDDRQRIPSLSNGGMPSRVTSMRASEVMPNMDLSRNSYSMWTLDHNRCRSPNRNLGNYSGLLSPGPPPPPRTEESQIKIIMREYNDPRMVTYAGHDFHEIARTMTTASFSLKSSLFDEPIKPKGHLVSPNLPLGEIVQRSRYPVEQLTVEAFLHSLGLDKYVISFRVEEVDMNVLSQMGEHDLKEMGIPMNSMSSGWNFECW